MDYLGAAVESFVAAWQPYYLIIMVVAVGLALPLQRTTRGAVLFALQMLLLFLVLLLGAAIADGLDASRAAAALRSVAVLALGMLLIRQVGLLFFRRIVPKLGFQPPRILEEIIILFAYAGWTLLRLASAGLDLGSLVASTAVITPVLALAMQATLGNILSGLALQLDHSVTIGDWIDFDGVSGEVVQVQWRHTAVRTLFGEMILVPNSQLMKARVMLIGGRSVPQRLRNVFFYGEFHIRPADVIQEIEAAMKHAECDAISSTPAPVCMITSFEGGLVTYVVRFWLIDPISVGRAESFVRQHIHAVFHRNGWRMANPSMDLHMQPRTGPEHRLANAHALDTDQRVQRLRGIKLFSPLTDDELTQLAQRLRPVHYVAGTRLATQGEVGDNMYIVSRGRAAVWLEAQGKRHLLAEPGTGEVIGEMSLMTGEPRRATVTARTDLDCYVLDKDGFKQTLENRPELAEAFAQLLTDRNRELAALRDNVPTVAESVERAAVLARIRKLFRV